MVTVDQIRETVLPRVVLLFLFVVTAYLLVLIRYFEGWEEGRAGIGIMPSGTLKIPKS